MRAGLPHHPVDERLAHEDGEQAAGLHRGEVVHRRDAVARRVACLPRFAAEARKSG